MPENKPNQNSDNLNEKKKIVQRRVQTFKNDGKNKDKKGGIEVEIVSIRRVTKVTKGGKRLRLSVFVVVGDKKGNIGYGIGKGIDVRSAQAKAVEFAKKRIFNVPLKGNTIPHEMLMKFGAAKIFMKPASVGTGVIAGGPVRKVLEIAGVKDVLTKQLGTANQISNVYCTVKALRSMKVKK